MRFSLVTFGCRVNQADSLQIEEQLRASGALPSTAEDADLVVVNTCSVTAGADQGARQTIRRIARANPGARIVVTGCYATRRPDEAASLPSVIRVVPNSRKEHLTAELADDLTTAERFGDGDGACGSSLEPGMMGRTAYTLRVQTGCEETCSYCIIPSTRGRSRSRPVDDVVDDVERVAAAGFKEIVLTGVHLGSYGRDLDPSSSLVTLLQRLADTPADVALRISSLEPMDCSPAIVDLVAHTGRFAPHFHLPLQHGSDRVLARMRRPYSSAFYRRLVDDIRSKMPNASIGSDVIVGFPGETGEDAAANEALIAAMPLTHLHVFPYSERPGTAAATLPERLDGETVRRRAANIRQIGNDLVRRFRISQVGTIRPGLTIEDGSTVVTDNYLKVKIEAGLARNARVRVRIEGSEEKLTGYVVSA